MSLGFIVVRGLEFIRGRLVIKSSCFFAVTIKAPKIGTSLKQGVFERLTIKGDRSWQEVKNIKIFS